LFKDLYEIIRDFIKNILSSRLFILGVIFSGMFAVLILHLFNLQIVEGQNYLDSYVMKTKEVISTQSTRGNIYDRNGKLLAYNELTYSVTVSDMGAYSDKAELNKMLLKLVHLLWEHNMTLVSDFKIALNQNNEFVYTTSAENDRNRFLADIYGLKSTEDLDKDGKNPSDITANEVVKLMVERYKVGSLKDDYGDPIPLDNKEILAIINIRYPLAAISYMSYKSVTVASNVDKETVADILENASDLQGVQIEEETLRRYNDSVYFAQIIGYTGKASKEELAELNKQNSQYALNDIVGKSGLEQVMELELQGTKGSQTMVLDSKGRILEIMEEETENPIAGNDIYLTIERDLQVGVYQAIESQLAGILANKIKNKDIIITENMDSSNMEIPVKTAYFQLINNNLLSFQKFALPEASEIEQQIDHKFIARQAAVIENIKTELTTRELPHQQLSEEMQVYMQSIYKYLTETGILITNSISENDSVYTAWLAGTISLKEFLYYGISNNWVDTTKLSVDEKYTNIDDVYQFLVEYIGNSMAANVRFNKYIYKYLIQDGTVTGRELCLALFEQGILPWDDKAVAALRANGNNYAYNFFMEKISKIEITPAQLALDPCSGFCVVTDVNSGQVLAMVSYPSYDNNKLSGTVDAAYYSQLIDDLSLPLYNNAAKVKTAPGSTFKPLSAMIGLEEGIIGAHTTITDTGIFTTITPNIKCWIYPGAHGALNVVGALRESCNYFFNEIGYRISTDSTGNYNEDLGLSVIQKYAKMFGLDSTAGIETEEAKPNVTTKAPVPSMIGQGSYSYTSVQIARYITTIANKGTVYNLSILNKLTDVNGNLLKEYSPTVSNTLDFKTSTWNLVHQGMREVITMGSVKSIFNDLEVPIAGKTGTAQENKLRANHSLFVSFGPFENPEISVTVQIPYGYSSANAAEIAENVYNLYYGYLSLETITENGAANITNTQVGD